MATARTRTHTPPELHPGALDGDLVELTDYPGRIAFRGDARVLATSTIKTTQLIALADRKPVEVCKSNDVGALLFRGDDLVIGAKTIGVRDARTRKQTLSLKGHKAHPKAFALSDDKARLFTAGGDYTSRQDRFVRAFDLTTGELVWQAKPGKDAGALSVAVMEDVVYVAAEDGFVRAFDANDGTAMGELRLGPDLRAQYMSPFGGLARSGDRLVATVACDGLKVHWLTPARELRIETTIDIPADPVAAVYAPMAAAGLVVCCVYGLKPAAINGCAIAVIDEASRKLTSIRAPTGFHSPDACALSPEGTFAWASGTSVALARLATGSLPRRSERAM